MYIPDSYRHLKSPIGTHPGQRPRASSACVYRAHLLAAAKIRKANIEDGIESLVFDDSPPPRPVHNIMAIDYSGPRPRPDSISQRPCKKAPCGFAMALLIAVGGSGLTLCLAATAIYGLQLALEQIAKMMGS